MLSTNKLIALAVLTVVVILLIYLFGIGKSEGFSAPFYFSDVAMKAKDPTKTFYTLRERDILGMDKEDYYLETQRLRDNDVVNVLEDGVSNFSNYTDYIEMPAEYRPVEYNNKLFLDKKFNKLEDNILEGMMQQQLTN